MAKASKGELKAEVKDGMLVVSIPMNDPPTASGSGKSLVVASTYGNQKLDLEIQGKKVTIGVNAYIPIG